MRSSLRNMRLMVRFALVFSAAVTTACNDDGHGGNDGGDDVDAAADGPPVDSGVVTVSGRMSLVESAVLDPGASGTIFGQGIRIDIAFTRSDEAPGPIMEDPPGPSICQAWEYTPAQAAAATIGWDEGSVAMSEFGTTPASLPTCTFSTDGYSCPYLSTLSGGGTITDAPDPAPPGVWLFTDADVTYDATNTPNAFLKISGAANAANNGAFPILGITDSHTVSFANPGGTAEPTLPATATHLNLAGAGPTPGAADPGFLANDAEIVFWLEPGGAMDFGQVRLDFSGTVTDDFTLPTATAAKLNAIPVDGSAITIPGAGGFGFSAVLDLVTTDAPLPIQPSAFFVMPPPVTRQAHVRCMISNVNTGTALTVPPVYSAVLARSGATRIQATFSRVIIGADDGVIGTFGHAIVGYTNVP
jgi:hypothetical protein